MKKRTITAGSEVAVKNDTGTLNYNFYSGEICTVIDTLTTLIGEQIATIENSNGRQIMIDYSELYILTN